MFEVKGKYTTAKIMADEIESECLSQIYGFVNHPAFNNPVSIMPDTHAGKGSVIGFTMPLGEKVIANVIGVDIGCGMLSFEFEKNELEKYDEVDFDKNVREEIPFGIEIRKDNGFDIERSFSWVKCQEQANRVAKHLNKKWNTSVKTPKYNYEYFLDLCDRIGSNELYAKRSVGTLGSGNHFIEVGRSEKTNNLWFTIHSGSRNLGKRVCEYWQRYARGEGDKKKIEFEKGLRELKSKFKGKELGDKINNLRVKLNKNINVKSKGLEFLEGEEAFGYIFDMIFAQIYAEINRFEMFKKILLVLNKKQIHVSNFIETIHNYISFKDFIIRKGAISSYTNERMIIPLNMEDGILLCKGKSNEEWNFSAPHGSGRLFSRSEAKEVINLEEAKKSMKEKGIFSTSIPIDEVKDAYKNSKFIEESIKPTAEIIDKIIPVHNLKDSSDITPPWKKKKEVKN